MARNSEIRCSFCNKTQDQVRRLIAGPSGVYICDECVEICADIIEEEYDEEEDERRAEMLRAKELEKAKKRRKRELLAEKKREAKAYAATYEFDDDELQPVDPSFKQPKKTKPKAQAQSTNNSEIPTQSAPAELRFLIVLGMSHSVRIASQSLRAYPLISVPD